SSRMPLPDIAEVRHLGDPAHVIEKLVLLVFLEIFFELKREIEVVFDGAFSPTRDDDDVPDAGRDCFFHRMLNEGFVDQRKHLFRRRLGDGKKTGTEARGRNNGFHDRGRHNTRFYGCLSLKVKTTGEAIERLFRFTFEGVICTISSILRHVSPACGIAPEAMMRDRWEVGCGRLVSENHRYLRSLSPSSFIRTSTCFLGSLRRTARRCDRSCRAGSRATN